MRRLLSGYSSYVLLHSSSCGLVYYKMNKSKKTLAVVSYEKQKKKDKLFALVFCLTLLVTSYLIIEKL